MFGEIWKILFLFPVTISSHGQIIKKQLFEDSTSIIRYLFTGEEKADLNIIISTSNRKWEQHKFSSRNICRQNCISSSCKELVKGRIIPLTFLISFHSKL